MGISKLVSSIEVMEDMFYKYDCDYTFEQGILYDDNGEIENIDIDDLLQDVQYIIRQLQEDSAILICKKAYDKAKDNILLLERLETLSKELNA